MLLLLWIVSLFIGATIGSSRGRTAAGFWWAFFLGPIGWLGVVAGPNLIREEAEKKNLEERRAHESRMEDLQREHLSELRRLRSPVVGAGPAGGPQAPQVPAIDDTIPRATSDGPMYSLRSRGVERGPISGRELLRMYESGEVSGQDEVSIDVPGEPHTYGMLSEELPMIRGALG